MARRGNDSAPEPKSPPTDRFERLAYDAGAHRVAGVDEAGRGPLAGPVVAAAVVLMPDNIPSGLDDSKRLSAAERDDLYEVIMASAAVSIAVASCARIDTMNILRASLWAMQRAVAGLAEPPDHVLIDGRDVPPGLPCHGQTMIGGDGLSVSIAAASIVAKVTRDRTMKRLALSHPDYGFERHKGYATRAHFAALDAHGPCPHHRRSFAPVRERQLGLGL
ncbi:MAG: ribonuclease HII [Alphaproteobacteria bacterium]